MSDLSGDIAFIAIREKRAMQDFSSFSRFLSFCYTIPHHSLLEIGSAYGGSLWAFQQIFGNVTSLTILEENEWGPALPVNGNVIYGDSDNSMVIEKARTFAPYDMIFVDGDHNKTLQDVRHYMPMTRFLAVHDIYTFCSEAWGFLKRQYEVMEFPGRCGIGLIPEQ